MTDQNTLYTAHLLRRAGFGASPATIQAAAAMGLNAVTHSLLNFNPALQTLDDAAFLNALASMAPAGDPYPLNLQAVKIWWTRRMLLTPNPLQEKMTLFWHGHFTSGNQGGDGTSFLNQNQLFRNNALGNFLTLTKAVSIDTAMLVYLNGNENVKAHPNENYARELMELFTCGVGHYTEADVQESARAFTGWTTSHNRSIYEPQLHDNGVKTFFDNTGNWDGNDIATILAAQTTTATQLCTELFEFFAYPDPAPSVIAPLIETYFNSGYDMKAVVGQILTSTEFYSNAAMNAVMKCPAQFVVGTVKMLGLESAFAPSPAAILAVEAGEGPMGPDHQQIYANSEVPQLARLAQLPVAMQNMGQDLQNPPSVKGWEGGELWINSATMTARVGFGIRLANYGLIYPQLSTQVAAYAKQFNVSVPVAWVRVLSNTLGPLALAAGETNALVNYAQTAPPHATAAQTAAYYSNLVPLIMGTAEFQVC